MSEGASELTLRLPAEKIVQLGTFITRAVALATGLDPHQRISQRVARLSRRPYSKSGAFDVAPVAPLLTQARDTVAARVDDGVVGHAGLLQGRPEDVDVELLILALIVLRVRGLRELARDGVPLVPAGHVGRDAAELRRRAAGFVSLGELLCAGLEVVLPWVGALAGALEETRIV